MYLYWCYNEGKILQKIYGYEIFVGPINNIELECHVVVASVRDSHTVDLSSFPGRLVGDEQITDSRGATPAKCAKKGVKWSISPIVFLMITLVKYTLLTVRKCMSAQNYQSRKGKTRYIQKYIFGRHERA